MPGRLDCIYRDHCLWANGIRFTQKELLQAIQPAYGNVTKDWKELAALLYLYGLDMEYDLISFMQDGWNINFTTEDYSRFQVSSMDAAFLQPVRLETGMEQQYISCHGKKTWNDVKQILMEEAGWAEELFRERELLVNNVFLMKRGIFRDFMGWLIPVLTKMSGRLEPQEIELLPKLTERLLTLYFKGVRKNVLYGFCTDAKSAL